MPPAASIALATVFMRANLQPKVAFSQQLIVARAFRNVQRMVANTRDEAKEAFSKKLHQALNRVDFPVKPARIRALSRALRVSYEAARKWLGGEAIPDQTNLLRICAILHIDMTELQIDFDPENREFGNDSFSRKLIAVWRELNDDVRGQILGFALVQATTRPAPDPKKDNDSEEEPTGS